MEKTDGSATSLGITIVQIAQYVFLGILIIANIGGAYFAYSVFTQITTPTPKDVQTIPEKLIPPFNQTLYDQIKKERANRTFYTNVSSVQTFSYPEVFKAGN